MEDILNNKNLKENPFKVPDGYFSEVEHKVMCSISAEKGGEDALSGRKNVFTILKPAISMAAMFAIVFGLGYGVMRLTNSFSSNVSSESIFAEQELTDEDFIGLMGNTNYQDIINYSESVEVVEPQINTDNIETYLIESGVSSFTTLASLE